MTGVRFPSSPPSLTRFHRLSKESDEVDKLDLSQQIYLYFMQKASDAFNNKYYFVYTLFGLKDKKLYTGFTSNLKQRLSEHFYGKVTSTKLRRPFKLIHSEMFVNKEEAKSREVFLKSGFGRKQLKEALKRTLKNLV